MMSIGRTFPVPCPGASDGGFLWMIHGAVPYLLLVPRAMESAAARGKKHQNPQDECCDWKGLPSWNRWLPRWCIFGHRRSLRLKWGTAQKPSLNSSTQVHTSICRTWWMVNLWRFSFVGSAICLCLNNPLMKGFLFQHLTEKLSIGILQVLVLQGAVENNFLEMLFLGRLV